MTCSRHNLWLIPIHLGRWAFPMACWNVLWFFFGWPLSKAKIRQAFGNWHEWHVIVKHVYVNNESYNDLGELIKHGWVGIDSRPGPRSWMMFNITNRGIRDIPKNVAMTIGTMVFGDIPWQWEPRIWLGDIPWICYLLVNFYITMENHHHVSWRNQALELSFIPVEHGEIQTWNIPSRSNRNSKLRMWLKLVGPLKHIPGCLPSGNLI